MYNFVKLLITAVCIALFTYQYVNLTNNYLQYHTETSIKYITEEITEIPALYFCITQPFTSRQMLSKLDQTKDLLRRNSDINYDEMRSKLDLNNSSDLETELTKHYEGLVAKGELKEILSEKEFLDDIEMELTELFLEFANGTSFDAQDEDLVMKRGRRILGDFRFGSIAQPQLYVTGSARNRCFSFLGNLENFRLFHEICSKSKISIHHRNLFLPDEDADSERQLYFTLLDKFDVPNFDEMTRINLDSSVLLQTSKTTVKTLPPPYVTGCRHYHDDTGIPGRIRKISTDDGDGDQEEEQVQDMEGDQGTLGSQGSKRPKDRLDLAQSRSQSDCMARCTFNFINRNLSKNEISLGTNYLINQAWLESEERVAKELTSRQQDRLIFEAERHCNRACVLGCNRVNYQMLPIFRPHVKRNRTSVHLKQSNLAVEIQHKPETTFLTYLGTLGGLAGIWLGVSFHAVFMALFELIGNTCRRKVVMSLRRIRHVTKRKRSPKIIKLSPVPQAF